MQIRCHVLRAPHNWTASLWPLSTPGNLMGKLPLDLKCHVSLHVGCILVISHRYLRPGIEASFLLASAYTTLPESFPGSLSLVHSSEDPSSGGLCRQSGSPLNPLSCTCLVPSILCHLACLSYNFLSPLLNSHRERGGRVHAKAPAATSLHP